jgi:tRNA-splicing ligase RtcB
LVVSSSGKPSKVTDTFKRGPKRVWRYRGNNFHADTVVTPDHLHFIGDMSSSNYQTQGRVKVLSRLNRDGTSKYVWCPLNELPESFTFLLPRKIAFASMPETFAVQHEERQIVPSYALGYSFGAFLGNGTARYAKGDGGQISWSRDAAKPEIVDKIAEQTREAFQVETKIYLDGSVKLCVVHDANLARLFEAFGKRTRKELPRAFWACQPAYVRGLYDGLIDTDGHTIDGVDKFTNTSTALIEQFGVLHYLLFGYFPSISRREPTAGGLPNVEDGDCRPSYRASALKSSAAVLTPDYQLVARLTHTEATNEIVDTFDIEVDNQDHSFVANNVIVHNSMGAKSFIVRGKGNAQSLHSCSHGAGRKMSRNAAKKAFTLADHAAATAGIECRKDEDVIDETPMAYKSIDDVMAAQTDLVEMVATLRQVLCVKG